MQGNCCTSKGSNKEARRKQQGSNKEATGLSLLHYQDIHFTSTFSPGTESCRPNLHIHLAKDGWGPHRRQSDTGTCEENTVDRSTRPGAQRPQVQSSSLGTKPHSSMLEGDCIVKDLAQLISTDMRHAVATIRPRFWVLRTLDPPGPNLQALR